MSDGNSDESGDKSAERFAGTGKDHVSVDEKGTCENLCGISANHSCNSGGYGNQ